MTSTHNPANPPQCPTCDYNLTGLTEQRCPECGEPFDWDDVLSKAADPVTIAFERSRGAKRLPGFVLTWATVLFAPWIFARQICQHVSLKSAIIFGAACCIPVTIRSMFNMDVPAYAAWMTTICLHILAQAIILSILDPNTLRDGLKAIRFWIAVGGYTTAVVVTECYQGPPMLNPHALMNVILDMIEGQVPEIEGVLLGYGGPESRIHIITLLLWLISVISCYAFRMRVRTNAGPLRILLTFIAAVALLFLFSLTSGRVAPWLWQAFGGSMTF